MALLSPERRSQSRNRFCGQKCKAVIFFGLGGFLVIVGSVLGFTWPLIWDIILQRELSLKPNSESYTLWKETPLPLYMDIYMFNWSNPEETLTSGKLPNLIEMGPYVFREHHTKINIKWNENDTVTFRQMRKWEFMPELSSGELSDNVTSINVIAMSLGAIIKKYVPKPMLGLLSNEIMTSKDKPYITKTVRELLFDGYEDEFLSIISNIRKFVKGIRLPADKFGWLYGRNMSSKFDGVFNMYCGYTDGNKMGLLHSWNKRTRTGYYRDECGLVQGTTGELWPLNSARKPTVEIFSSDICSSLHLKRGDKMRVGALDAVKFIGDSSSLSAAPCYCSSTGCPPEGVRDISPCHFGAPAFVSYPHFLHSHLLYSDHVTGLQANLTKHQFEIVLFERTGVPLLVNARLQLNVLCEPIEDIPYFKNIPSAMMPMFWFEHRAKLPEDLSTKLQKTDRSHIIITLLLCVALLGLALVLWGVVAWMRGQFRPQPPVRIHWQQGNADNRQQLHFVQISSSH